MTHDTHTVHALPRALGNGLVIRHATPADTEALVALQLNVFRNPQTQQVEERLGWWTRDLMSGRHPTFAPGDFTVVEDTKSGALVSSLNLISQKWTYDGIEFGVGRPEIVCTLPDYRRNGLIRAQFEIIHAWSAQRGEMVQAITGIPFYYRQYGYEMAMNLGGARVGPAWQTPQLKEGESEPYGVRPASEADLPFIVQMVAQADRRSLVAAVRSEALWRYELSGMSEQNMQRMEFRIIETPAGSTAGLLVHPSGLWDHALGLTLWELAPGVSWPAVAPSVMRYMVRAGKEYAERSHKQCEAISLSLGAEHPAYKVLASMLPVENPPYAWYVRVPDLPRFLRHIAPALERRLAGSLAVGHSGELKISFYRTGVRLAFEEGRLALVEPWTPRPGDDGSAAFPGLTFLQLLFGHRDIAELRHAFPDCWVEGDTARVLLDVLFPKRPSHIWPVY